MTRLDHDRAVWQVAEKTGSAVTDIQKVVVWGNHSPTMSPDLRWATVKGKSALYLMIFIIFDFETLFGLL